MNRIALTCCLTLPSSLATSMASYELRRSLQTAHCSEGVHQSSTGRTQLQSQATLLLALSTRQCTHLPLFSPSYCLSQSPLLSPLSPVPSSPVPRPSLSLSSSPFHPSPPYLSLPLLSTLPLPLPLFLIYPTSPLSRTSSYLCSMTVSVCLMYGRCMALSGAR